MAYPGVSRATKSRMLMARRAGSSPPCRGREEGDGVLQAGGGREDSTYPSGVRGEEIGAQPTLCDSQPDTVRGEGCPASNPPHLHDGKEVLLLWSGVCRNAAVNPAGSTVRCLLKAGRILQG